MAKAGARIGLTGGIGSGKSTVGQMLAELGATLIDADQISREVTAPGGAAIGPIASAFGNDFIDASGALDRARMRTLVFEDPQARARLEALVHPLVAEQTSAKTQAALAQGSPLIVLDIPLLVESGRWARQLDAVVVVDCSPATQIQRVVARSGLSAQAVDAIIASQAPRSARRAAADIVIHNEGLSLDALKTQAGKVAQLFGL